MADGSFVATNRYLFARTPFGPNTVILRSFNGHEAISELFSFQLDFVSTEENLEAKNILGQPICFGLGALDGVEERPFNGIVARWTQLGVEGRLMQYRAEVVPWLWLLTRRVQSRIFQHLSVPDILKKVLEGGNVEFLIQGQFQPRNYCVQYNESDFQFASRLMEEEGIFYFFKHSAAKHVMVLANAPGSHPPVPVDSDLLFEEILGGDRDEERITSWEKVQEVRSGKYMLWDHKFELPHKHLEAEKPILESIQVGEVQHSLKLGVSEKLEVYEYPGYYSKRFDGVSSSGGDEASELGKIFQDNSRTVGIRMQQEEALSILINGSSNCRRLTSGHKFTFDKHSYGNGAYTLVSVTHTGNEGGLYSGIGSTGYAGEQGSEDSHYSNTFTCIPAALPFRPQRATPKPLVRGCQTAVVVGPAGEEIYTDKYSRVKVQFHWDREGRNDAESSCWVRVATHWAGKQWGIIHIPRIGQEVVVDFLEGDPDQPIVVGSVYNADMMPPFPLPANMTQSGIRSRSTKGAQASNCNVIRFEDKKGAEQVYIHAEKDMLESVENNSHEYIGYDRFLMVKKDQREVVDKNKHALVKGEQRQQVDKDKSLTMGGNLKQSVTGNSSMSVKGKSLLKVGGNVSEDIGGNLQQKVGSNCAIDSGMEVHIKAGMKVIIEAGVQLSLKGPGGFVDIGPTGVTISGMMVLINSGGAAGSGSGCSVEAPEPPDAPDLPEIGLEEKCD